MSGNDRSFIRDEGGRPMIGIYPTGVHPYLSLNRDLMAKAWLRVRSGERSVATTMKTAPPWPWRRL